MWTLVALCSVPPRQFFHKRPQLPYSIHLLFLLLGSLSVMNVFVEKTKCQLPEPGVTHGFRSIHGDLVEIPPANKPFLAEGAEYWVTGQEPKDRGIVVEDGLFAVNDGELGQIAPDALKGEWPGFIKGLDEDLKAQVIRRVGCKNDLAAFVWKDLERKVGRVVNGESGFRMRVVRIGRSV